MRNCIHADHSILSFLISFTGRVGSTTPDKGVPDMTSIPDIDENGINRNLKVRYDRDEIYVSINLSVIDDSPQKLNAWYKKKIIVY